MNPAPRIAIVTLGCDKNTVDSERYRAALIARGAQHVGDPADADVVIVNTCGFIDSAKKESIDALVEAGARKSRGSVQAVVAVGCMVERHAEELRSELPDVDFFLGASEMDRLVPALEERGIIGSEVLLHPGTRVHSGEGAHVRYLKVSEGCDHGCAFCAIPLMRGRHRSFSLPEIVQEAQLLEMQGAVEVNLVAQDLAHYGRDIRDGNALPELLEALVRETGIPWIRMLYLYSAGVTDRLLRLIAAEPRVLPYLDMPMQHASDAVLARMRRPERARTIRQKVALARELIPDVAIRTTCIVGFPGESDDDFEQLYDLVGELRFDSVGVFQYSEQEGTAAALLPDDVPPDVKRERQERLSELQRALTAERLEDLCGRTIAAVVNSSADGSSEGRIWRQADDIDGITNIAGVFAAGTLLDVEVTDLASDYDLVAKPLAVRRAASTPARPGRKLPMLAGSIGSFGR